MPGRRAQNQTQSFFIDSNCHTSQNIDFPPQKLSDISLTKNKCYPTEEIEKWVTHFTRVTPGHLNSCIQGRGGCTIEGKSMTSK